MRAPVRALQSGQGANYARSADARHVRLEAAGFEQRFPLPAHVSNGDEARFPNRLGSYSKGLPHNYLGEVEEPAYQSLLDALDSGDPADFERIVLGDGMPLVNPQAGLAFDLHGPDSHALGLRPAPAFDSGELAAEIAENYWMAIARDVPFSEYRGHPVVEPAAADLSRLQGFRGPREGGRVSAATLFRGVTPGDLAGPYISQFLWRRTPFGAEEVDRRIRTAPPGLDYMTSYLEWLDIQNGAAPASELVMDPVPRYVRSGRDLAVWVRNDVIFQAYLDALLILLDLGIAFDGHHPYRSSRIQRGFGTFGEPHVAAALCAVTTKALKAVWFQKWFVHRRLRPEAFAGRIHNQVSGIASYPIHPDILGSPVLAEVAARTGSYLLPMAYPEGAPLHPAYGAGHATVAGACVTVLKAFFDESAAIPDPVEATPDGLSLQPCAGVELRVGDELNKLASNISLGRDFAGLHWRSDVTESLLLGEEVAIRYLAEERPCFNEAFGGFSLTRFDGTRVTV
ncbi:MAG TPA: vanadium-dependent haloperoxidase [Vicinamibacterales bacterium]|nr:vanadium-dependent haloperoxidase [Vicinamibacterales bacterium]